MDAIETSCSAETQAQAEAEAEVELEAEGFSTPTPEDLLDGGLEEDLGEDLHVHLKVLTDDEDDLPVQLKVLEDSDDEDDLPIAVLLKLGVRKKQVDLSWEDEEDDLPRPIGSDINVLTDSDGSDDDDDEPREFINEEITLWKVPNINAQRKSDTKFHVRGDERQVPVELSLCTVFEIDSMLPTEVLQDNIDPATICERCANKAGKILDSKILTAISQIKAGRPKRARRL
jgi:hypothetical protein